MTLQGVTFDFHYFQKIPLKYNGYNFRLENSCFNDFYCDINKQFEELI